jgi:plastocyanin
MRRLTLAIALLALLGPACGGGSSSGSGSAAQAQPSAAPTIPPGATEVDVTEQDPSSMKLSVASVAHGQIGFKVSNAGPGQHDFHVQVKGQTADLGSTPLISGGGSQVLVLTLQPGTYSVYCGVPGHRAAGMEATLTVT